MSSLTNTVEVKALDRFTWVDFTDFDLKEDQIGFVPSVLHSIAESKFDNCTPMGIWYQGKPVGFIMYCNFNRLCWISRVLVDAGSQGKGIAKAAIMQVVEKLQRENCGEIRTSVVSGNEVALALFRKCGFQLFGRDAAEVILRYEG